MHKMAFTKQTWQVEQRSACISIKILYKKKQSKLKFMHTLGKKLNVKTGVLFSFFGGTEVFEGKVRKVRQRN